MESGKFGMKNPLLVIAGPTACGKTGLSVALAAKMNGEIISADSMQIYKHMDIGTAKISNDEMQGIKHYLIDLLYPDEEFNVMIFQQKAKEALSEIYQRNKIPFIVGGTGFYINALVNDNNFMETCEDFKLRESLYKLAEKEGAEYLHNMLSKIDSDSAKIIHANNIKRVARAIEFFQLTGKPISAHNKEEKLKKSPYETTFLILTMERKKLYQRIEERIDLMIERGLVKEVEQLLNKGYSSKLVSMQGLGYKEIVSYLNDECSLSFSIELLKKRTRHFAKRQITWFKGQSNGFWLDVTDLSENDILEKAMYYLEQKKIHADM